MYKISVPVGNSTMDRYGAEETLEILKRFDAQRVFLSLGYYETDENRRAEALSALKKNTKILKDAGYETGAWVWAFSFGSDVPYSCMTGLDGTQYKTIACPSDNGFLDFAADYIKDIARCGVDMIMFDDDYRYGFFGAAPACLCKNHVAAINAITKEEHGRDFIEKNVLTGGRNKYRDAYIRANGDAFRNFAKRIRQAADEVDRTVRVGFCTCMTGWDLDGVDAAEIARILAGPDTRPFVRLIGAPYWAVHENWGNRLEDTVEMERMESVWTRGGDIELMAEGDPFPRPRMNCPASYLEGYDTAIRASGALDGILKYGVDYYSRPGTEPGYARMHERNRDAYKWIDENFKGEPYGIRVFTPMKKLADAVAPTKVNERIDPERLVFPLASRSLSFCSVPTTFEGEGVCRAVFGECARPLGRADVKDGLIVDIAAAGILTENGVDCGVVSIGEKQRVHSERFLSDGELINVRDAVIYDTKFQPSAKVCSCADAGGREVPVSVLYENGDGQRFLILNVNTEAGGEVDIMRYYRRSRQYADAAEWISGKKLPAYVEGCPALYIQCRRDEQNGTLTVGFWNFFADPAMQPTVELDGEYRDAVCFRCEGKLEGDKLYLSDIPPYGFAAVRLAK
ncbi:MAG: hypothetical protein J5879_00065 [Clostridia bacterium]|nr:hypothetical protein [Clostridia bacterium]